MIKERQGVQGALAVGNGFSWVRGATVASSVRGDQIVFAQEFLAASVNPILVATAAAVEKKERFSRAFRLVIQMNPVYFHSVPFVLSWYVFRMEHPCVFALI